jgi:hypothetical protein
MRDLDLAKTRTCFSLTPVVCYLRIWIWKQTQLECTVPAVQWSAWAGLLGLVATLQLCLV